LAILLSQEQTENDIMEVPLNIWACISHDLGFTLPSYILLWPRPTISYLFLLGGGITVNELYRAERCRDLADEYRRIAAICASTEMRDHYSRISEHYRTLAESEERPALRPT
jgi:hypothetical protein